MRAEDVSVNAERVRSIPSTLDLQTESVLFLSSIQLATKSHNNKMLVNSPLSGVTEPLVHDEIPAEANRVSVNSVFLRVSPD